MTDFLALFAMVLNAGYPASSGSPYFSNGLVKDAAVYEPGEALISMININLQDLPLSIRTFAAWCQTWGMGVIAIIAVSAVIYALIQLRTRYLRQRRRELEVQVRGRTYELLDKNEELARLNKLQEAQQSELTRFLAVASHDLRQPMHALTLYLSALSNQDMSDPARGILDKACECARIMDDMFLALLDLSRLDAHIVKPKIERFPIGALLSSIEVEFAPQAKVKGLQLRVAHCSAWVESDQALIRQILGNLTANAVRYTESGSILVGCRRRGKDLRIAVIDTGIGISPDQQRNVFEEFRQLGGAGGDSTKGLGLGLAIVRRLATLLSVPIKLESTLAKGSMFAIDLPMVEPTQEQLAKPVEPDTTMMTAQLGELDGKFIVVIDDDESILDAMRVLLEQWRCNVVTARSGTEMLAKLSEATKIPDVIICDYQLCLNETGLDVVKLLREEFNSDIEALIITGTVNSDLIQKITNLGMNVLHKPVNDATLHNKLLQLTQYALSD